MRNVRALLPLLVSLASIGSLASCATGSGRPEEAGTGGAGAGGASGSTSGSTSGGGPDGGSGSGASGAGAAGGAGGAGAAGGAGGAGAAGGAGGAGAAGGAGGAGAAGGAGGAGAAGGAGGGEGSCRTTLVAAAPGTYSGNTGNDPWDTQVDPVAGCWVGNYGYTVGSSEHVKLDLPAGGTLTATITASAFGGTGDVSLVLVEGCNGGVGQFCTAGFGTCITDAECLIADKGTTPSLSYTNASGAPKALWVLVDGHTANSGSYTLSLDW
jgi:hypothetical protein